MQQHILLVEDDQTIAMGLVFALEGEGYQVSVCHDAKSGLLAAQNTGFDLAILDVSLPGGSGYDICRAIKQSSDTPVIFLTVYNQEAEVVMGLDMGADDYIAKPFRLRELISRVRTVLRRSGGAERDEITCGKLILFARQGKVTKNGQELSLTALEYRLLNTFFLNKGQLLTRTRLLEDIWDVGGDFVNDNTLTVYIKRLREKIEDDPQNPLIIRTVRGLGYRMGE